MDMKTDLTLTSTFSGLFPQGNKNIGSYSFTPFVAGYIPAIIPIPVVITPVIDVYVGSTVIGFQSQASVNQTATLTAGIEFNSGVWTPINSLLNNFAFTAPTNVTIQPGTTDGKDAYGRWSSFTGSSIPNENYNTTSLRVENSSQYAAETFIQFPFSSIPLNSTIDSAKLDVHGYCVSGLVSASNINVGVKKVTGSWSESTLTWNTKPSYDSATTSSASIPNSGAANWHEFDVKPLVQNWVNGGINRGLVLSTSTGESQCFFKSSEYSTPSQSPKLAISYH